MDTHKRILIVDDVEELSEYLSIVLRKWGYETAVASSGEEALAKFSSFKPQLSIVDIGMPLMDGYEVARTLRASYDNAFALIALSGYGATNDKIMAHQSGFDLHLTKPAKLPSLKEIIDGYFAKPSSLALLTELQWKDLMAVSTTSIDADPTFKLSER